MKLISKIIMLAVVLEILLSPAVAQTPAKPEDKKALTKGEAVMLLSTTDFIKKKISDLLSWTVGYDISKLSRVRLTPSINYVKVMPRRVPPDGRTVFDLVASVDDPEGLSNIAGVRADLSGLGRLSNMMLVDNGLFGDSEAGDGIYTLQTSIPSKIDIGKQEIPVAVANKKGWLALAKTSVDVRKNPRIIESGFSRKEAKADSREITRLTVKIDNPGRREDIKEVTADLRAIGYTDILLMRNDGEKGDLVAADDTYSLQFVVHKSAPPGEYIIKVRATNFASGSVAKEVVLKVYR